MKAEAFFRVLAWTVLVVPCVAACSRAEDARKGKEKAMAIKLTSSAFAEGQTIPVKHTGQGQDVSPALKWTGAPVTARSFALICDDPDAPGKVWVHWVLWNIPADASELTEKVAKLEELPNGIRQGNNDFPGIGYNGPMPPPGKPHRYYFKLYALDAKLDLKPGAAKPQLLDAMKGHIVAEGQLMGAYKRR